MFSDCTECKEQKKVLWRDLDAEAQCDVCMKPVMRVLDLHHTGALLCSLQCEQTFWLNILY